MTPCQYPHRRDVRRTGRPYQKPPAKWRVTPPWSDVPPILVCGVHVRPFRTWASMGGRYRIEPYLREVTK